MCFVLCLMINNLTNATILLQPSLSDDDVSTCKILGYIFMASNLMSFMWLNVIGFDILRAFRTDYGHNHTRKFMFYCAYAFGLSSLLILIAVILNEYELIPTDYRNDLGNGICFSGTTKTNALIYTFSPMIFTLVLNSIFFAITAYKLYQVRNTECGRQISSNASSEIRRWLYF